MVSNTAVLNQGHVLSCPCFDCEAARLAEKENPDGLDEDQRAVMENWTEVSSELGINDEAEDVEWEDSDTFCADGETWRFLDDDAADEAAKEQVKERVWAFNSSFLAGETGLDEAVFTALEGKYEEANDPILSLIEATCGIDDFSDAAITEDGRGHLLSPWDSEETSVHINDKHYYFYRQD